MGAPRSGDAGRAARGVPPDRGRPGGRPLGRSTSRPRRSDPPGSSGSGERPGTAWSSVDDFAWAEGRATRFGIVHIGFGTRVRTPKMNAMWYSQVARGNALVATVAP
ncbi:family 1 glycosylhydrolase [Actinosynnema sp. NPDC023587]|uniref:family 1 glycosylhydrolase n=1 Tax=Actinosynnema sp. NPDC023587 TaxID=3154695 RepID=UPI0033FCB772